MASKNPGVYSDLGKKSNDLLNKDFPDRNKLEWKAKRGDANLDLNFALNQDKSIFGSIFPKYRRTIYGRGLTLGVQVDTNRAAKVEAIVDQLAPGLKVIATGHLADESLTIEGEYKRDYLSLSANANILSPKGTKVEASVVGGHNGVAAGLQAEYHTDKISKLNGSLSYTQREYTGNLFARINPQDSSSQFGLSYYQNHANGGVVAEGSLDPTKSTPKITLGGSYTLDDKSSVKGKVDTTGRIGLSYGVKLSSNARLVVASSINSNNLSSAGNHNLGFLLSFE